MSCDDGSLLVRVKDMESDRERHTEADSNGICLFPDDMQAGSRILRDDSTCSDGMHCVQTESMNSETGKSAGPVLSPSSLYTTSKLDVAVEESVVNCVVLCSWDNIMGPRVRHLWQTENECCVTSLSLLHIANHTLNGEICRSTRDSTIDIKLYTMTEINLVAMTAIFGAVTQNVEEAVHSLTLVTPQHVKGCLLDWYSVCCASMERLIPRLRVLLHKNDIDAAMQDTGVKLSELIQVLKHLEEHSLQLHIPISETAFWAANSVEQEFLCEAIASHLATSGRTVVLGKTAYRVNMMLNTLSLFISERERAFSAYVSESTERHYHPDLCLQGLLKSPGGPISDSLLAVYEAPGPVTLVDLTTLDVKQTAYWPAFAYRRHEALTRQLTDLWQDQNDQQYSSTSEEQFYTYEEKDTLVTSMLEQLSLLEPVSGLREAYLLQFTRMLEIKALALIKYIDVETNKGRTTIHNIKKLTTDLGIMRHSDLKIVLGTAERLRAGMANFLLGDPKLTTERLVASYIQMD